MRLWADPDKRKTAYISHLVRKQLAYNDRPIEQLNYEIEKVIDKRTEGRKVEYMVQWKGWDAAYDTWYPKSQLNKAKRLIKEYEERR